MPHHHHHPEPLDLDNRAAQARPQRPLHDRAAALALEAQRAAALPPHTLMQRAGLAVARLARAVAPHAREFVVLAGPGNNGGDGFEAARLLHEQGCRVQVLWLPSDRPAPADAARSQQRARLGGVTITDLSLAPALDPQAWLSAVPAHALIIDALLGRGTRRAGPADRWIAALPCAAAPVLAVDLPSGLDGDTGQAAGPCAPARWTLALLTLAPGLFTAEGRAHAGEVWYDALGHTPQPEPTDAGIAWLECGAAMGRHLPALNHGHHKGRAGDVWVVGGATGMSGAALLAGQAAVQAGAGRVYLDLLAPAGEQSALPCPELLHGHRPDAEVLTRSTVVAGCGGGAAIAGRLGSLLAHSARLVLDADALNAVAADSALSEALAARSAAGLPTVITPHPLEAARLLGTGRSGDVQSDRLRAAADLARRWGVVAVLKGSGTVVARPGHPGVIVSSGNAALATAGTGDVLAGLIGALWARIAAHAPTRSRSLPAEPKHSWLDRADAGAPDLSAVGSAALAAAYLHGWVAHTQHPEGEAWPAGSLAQSLSAALEHWRRAGIQGA
jgi:ADP-dependent NAD(P)H-hydrate dehydratase / NAD(P)H-hydrate epimerase